jgi:hypothetical protein
MKKKILIGLCALAVCLLTACLDFCGFDHGDANSTYTWSYTNTDGTKSSGEFTTNQYGQGSFDVPDNVDCNQVTVTKKESDVSMLEDDSGNT